MSDGQSEACEANSPIKRKGIRVDSEQNDWTERVLEQSETSSPRFSVDGEEASEEEFIDMLWDLEKDQ